MPVDNTWFIHHNTHCTFTLGYSTFHVFTANKVSTAQQVLMVSNMRVDLNIFINTEPPLSSTPYFSESQQILYVGIPRYPDLGFKK